jgi:hypothetical protein
VIDENQRPLPSMFRVAWLIVSFALRRSLNRLQALRKKDPRANTQRDGTGRKPTTGAFLGYVFSALFLFSGVSQATKVVRSVALLAERSDGNGIALVSANTLAWLDWADERSHSSSWKYDGKSRAKLREALETQADSEGVADAGERTRRTDWRMQLFDERGRAAFSESKLREARIFPSLDNWYGPRDNERMLVPLGLIALLLSVSIALFCVAGPNQDLAKVEWTLEWWFTFPVPARGLLLARVLETTFASPFAWFVLGPFFSITFWCAGYGWLGVPLGAFCVIYVGLLAGSVRVVTETSLRRWISLRNVARLQATLSVVSVVPLVAALAASAAEPLAKLVRVANRLPPELFLNPLSPIAIAAGGARAAQSLLACSAFACGVAAAGGPRSRQARSLGRRGDPFAGRAADWPDGTQGAVAAASGSHATFPNFRGSWNPVRHAILDESWLCTHVQLERRARSRYGFWHLGVRPLDGRV